MNAAFPDILGAGEGLWLVFSFVAGASLGSFMNVLVHRGLLGISIVLPASRCPCCLRFLSWFENIPVLSWLFLRARCRGCGAAIASSYFWVELISGGFSLVAWYAYVWQGGSVADWGTALFVYAWVVVLALADGRARILPDAFTAGVWSVCFVWKWTEGGGVGYGDAFPTAVWALVSLGAPALLLDGFMGWLRLLGGNASVESMESKLMKFGICDLSGTLSIRPRWILSLLLFSSLLATGCSREFIEVHASGTLVGGGVLYAIRFLGRHLAKLDAVGLGDIKYAAAIGFLAGPMRMIFVFLIASFLASAYGIIRFRSLKGQVPLGPFLGLGALVVLLPGFVSLQDLMAFWLL
ncbi:MAG: prepilin peptidase [Planctomycetes bacterium]|nr:prepilin peptidase [Planctomycetota bacterium]